MRARRSVVAAAVVIIFATSLVPAKSHPPTPPQVIPPGAFHEIAPPASPLLTAAPTAAPTPSIVPAPTVRPTQPPRATPAPKPTPRPTPVPARPTVADAQAWALARLGPTQYACLADIVKHEDFNWNPFDTNSSSGAYGIPQALPGSKMASAGSDWRWNRITQLKWMLGYVNGPRYGSACIAAAFRTAHGWY